jgi:hypothetical protein
VATPRRRKRTLQRLSAMSGQPRLAVMKGRLSSCSCFCFCLRTEGWNETVAGRMQRAGLSETQRLRTHKNVTAGGNNGALWTTKNSSSNEGTNHQRPRLRRKQPLNHTHGNAWCWRAQSWQTTERSRQEEMGPLGTSCHLSPNMEGMWTPRAPIGTCP